MRRWLLLPAAILMIVLATVAPATAGSPDKPVTGCINETNRVKCIQEEANDVPGGATGAVWGILCYTRGQGDPPTECPLPPTLAGPPDDVLVVTIPCAPSQLPGELDPECLVALGGSLIGLVGNVTSAVVFLVCPAGDCFYWVFWLLGPGPIMAIGNATTLAGQIVSDTEDEAGAWASGASSIVADTLGGNLTHVETIRDMAMEGACASVNATIGPFPPVC